ncbi:4-amino-4-deoxychorismate lyase [Ruegeria marisrubri]|uniref:Probable branched-chain-amino-acid aminotransferase n=1 Tax=Ruegeria marisrubri TaxID=1685379 RepID=A0A0X3TC36_9RHOB|nr:aminotransferase class IV family protein [Ruegeria marisrubri]KUJ73354.1 4-amino-4-deoxychorismate lyase [Ruegeria marisrubri]
MESALCPPAEPGFRLIETLGYRPGAGLVRRDRHLARMARSAAALGMPFDRVRAEATPTEAKGDAPLRCRLTLDISGAFELATGPLTDTPPLWRVAIAKTRLISDDPWLRHKTTRRALYDTARANLPRGVDELLFLNERGELCEGTITNVFVETRDGRKVTPPLSSGLLPGILREELLEKGQFAEEPLTLSDLMGARQVFVGNSLRGLIPVELVSG